MADIKVIHTVSDLRSCIVDYRRQGKKIGLAPTMGNLHEGHISLADELRKYVDIVVTTIFVNPKQFGENEDFGSYPRSFEEDKAKLQAAGVEVLYAPHLSEMYPDGFSTNVSVSGVSSGLCGDARPGHFDGVCTVVTKLLLQALPDVAVFGEKDYQQLAVIKRFARDLDIPVEIIGAPILREADGLAMSSRNGYLSPEEREIAPALNRIMRETVTKLADGAPEAMALEEAISKIHQAGFAKVDYFEIRNAINLQPATYAPGDEQRLFAAAHLGRARLIDNIAI
ncbi:MAG: pantoate--beta-alanine ligase [Alphaproteobacteria bacterium]|nr:pantoate--beta-alanine ligase [Alphaproteobacteria bacterium]